FVDMETGQEVITQPWHIRSHYHTLMSDLIEKYRRDCRDSLIDYALVDSSEEFDTALFRYLAKRKKLG
ncbi:MAG: DUF58 domain-containing protein, partial [Candidatus Latescibacteria bacterium]|nr:DUF58 domain-containing protein [Candidatus Latescibacterota bacterium]